MRRLILVLALLLAALTAPASAQQSSLDDATLRAIPIQDHGRLKPIDTFARETVFTITGKERFEGRPALDTLLTWMSNPEEARKAAVIDVSRQDVRAALGLPDGRWVSADALLANPTFQTTMREISALQKSGQDLDALQSQMARLLQRLNLFAAVISGEAWTIVPNPTDASKDWGSLLTIGGADASVPPATARAIFDDFRAMLAAYASHDAGAFATASKQLSERLAAVGPGPNPAIVAAELRYNSLHPFGKAWMLYLAALLVLSAAGVLDSRKLYGVGVVIALGGLVMHVYGFYLRCLIAGRPPVTNMYESVIWVSLGAVVFALLLEAVYRARSLLVPATAVATLCLMLADNTSSILDPAINPLTPVLRSNFWLTIHVLTITASYGAFLLATALGHASLWSYGFHPDDRARQRSLHQQLYKTVQVGVLLLAAGTILGGVWANYSWGRFWGWDPKEVWALIALLGYLSVLHGRYAGWLKDFGFAAGCVVAYCGVLMAWYGVNFVLGAGLHSYGFGDGGQQWVGLAVALDLLFVAAMATLYRRRSRA